MLNKQQDFGFTKRVFTQVLYCDGFLFGPNPAQGGGGTVCTTDGTLIRREEVIKENYTNNEAELFAVLLAAESADPGSLIITDSMNTLSWVQRGGTKARKDLFTMIRSVKALLENKKLTLQWEKRELNTAGIYNETYPLPYPLR